MGFPHYKRVQELSFALLASCIVLAGCKEDKQNSASSAPPPPQVTVQEVSPSTVPLSFEYAGRTAGSREVEVRARVSGILLKRNYVEGQRVMQGSVLFTIDPEPYKAALAQAEARFKETDRDWQRVSKLYAQKAVSGRERDQVLSAYEQAKAALVTAQLNLGYTTVTAPITGITSQEARSEGSLVQAGTDSSLLTKITQLDPVYVHFAYPDAEILKQDNGENRLKVELLFGNGSAYPHEGYVDFTDSIIEAETGTVRARAVVPNPDATLLPGQFVRVVVKGIERKNAVVIPEQAIMQGPQGTFVYTVTAQGKAAIQPVVLGSSSDKGRIVEQGLKSHDRVIIEGMIKVRPDQPVQVEAAGKKPAMPSSKPASPAAK
jgi:membrane fusion protein, multidrug efflux system